MSSNTKIISFINMKGGVGKTTLTVNIADQLAMKNKKVLVIDTDPQFNSTQTLLLHKNTLDTEQQINGKFEIDTISEDSESDKTIEKEVNSAKEYKRMSERKETILQIFEPTSLTEPSKNPSLIQNIKNNLDLMPGDLKLAQHISGDTANKVNVLEDHFEKYNLYDVYDYILIDCPPTWSILTHASLYASDYYITPSKVDFYSSIGIQLLEEQITNKIINNSMYKKTGKTLESLGVAFTFVHNTTKLPTEKKRKDIVIEEFKENLSFFESELPYIPSAQTKFPIFSDVKENRNYRSLINFIEKITDEIEGKIASKGE